MSELREEIAKIVYEACLAHAGDKRYLGGPTVSEAADRILALLDESEPVDAPPNAIRPAFTWADGRVREWWVDDGDGDGPKVVPASPTTEENR